MQPRLAGLKAPMGEWGVELDPPGVGTERGLSNKPTHQTGALV
jgi:hypothetical protein